MMSVEAASLWPHYIMALDEPDLTPRAGHRCCYIISSTFGTVATAQMHRRLGSEEYDESVDQYHAVSLYNITIYPI